MSRDYCVCLLHPYNLYSGPPSGGQHCSQTLCVKQLPFFDPHCQLLALIDLVPTSSFLTLLKLLKTIITSSSRTERIPQNLICQDNPVCMHQDSLPLKVIGPCGLFVMELKSLISASPPRLDCLVKLTPIASPQHQPGTRSHIPLGVPLGNPNRCRICGLTTLFYQFLPNFDYNLTVNFS